MSEKPRFETEMGGKYSFWLVSGQLQRLDAKIHAMRPKQCRLDNWRLAVLERHGDNNPAIYGWVARYFNAGLNPQAIQVPPGRPEFSE